MISLSVHELIDRLPKAELQVHTESAPMYLDKAAACSSSPAALTARTTTDYALWVHTLGAQAARQNIRYQELAVSPALQPGLSFADIAASLREGRRLTQEKFGVEQRFIVNLDRACSAAWGQELLQQLGPHRESAAVIALGLAGKGPSGRHQKTLEDALELGLALSVETEGQGLSTAERAALIASPAARIRLSGDVGECAGLIDWLALYRIPVSLSPTRDLAQEPAPEGPSLCLRTLLQTGVMVSICTDDQPDMRTELNQVCKALADTCNLGHVEVFELLRNSVAGSFLPSAEKAARLRHFDDAASLLLDSIITQPWTRASPWPAFP